MKELNKETKPIGPSGFIELAGQMLVVDYGKIYSDSNLVGFLYEDGLLKDIDPSLSDSNVYTSIDEIPNCVFRGIDLSGFTLELPGGISGPTGTLKYNGILLNVINGRIATHEHKLVGYFEDDGSFYIRDSARKIDKKKLDENTQLTTIFQGSNSQGKTFNHEFVRQLYRKDKSYSDNEIIRYFENFDGLPAQQKRYVIDSLKLWAVSGFLQVVRKSEGTAALGNVKHGVAGATGVRTGYVTLDREEFEKEILLSKKFGQLATIATKLQGYYEVRLNLVVSHEYGHQLEFILSQAAQTKFEDLYLKQVELSGKINPLPKGYDGTSELLRQENIAKRVFVSGYSRQSKYEYFAECAAAFSVKESRYELKRIDPEAYAFFVQLLTCPEEMVRAVFVDIILDLRSSLKLGGEFDQIEILIG